jgi:hypothetical protein
MVERRREQDDRIDQILTKIEDIHSYLHGRPPDKPGLITRVDRMEQIQEQRAWHIKAIYTALIAGFVSWLFAIFGRDYKP